jgi:2-polyprenyl-3-methyl-5-hydroxy-6-metoxy-1,4-benzoquinol methylase
MDEGGIVYSPLADQWQRNNDMDVNYMTLAHKRIVLA